MTMSSHNEKTAFEGDSQGDSTMMHDSQLPTADALDADAGNRHYRCYFTDDRDRIQSYEQIECEDDVQAALKAQALLAASHFTSAELWSGKRIVGKWGNNKSERR
jgi:hypothetical protein